MVANEPPAEARGPILAGQQLHDAVVPALGLQQRIALERAAFAHAAVDRTGDVGGARGDGPRIRSAARA